MAPDAAGAESRPDARRRLAALTGIAAGAVTIAVATALAAVLAGAGLAGGTPSPVLAVGSAFIDATPPWLKDWAIAVFDTHDKTALVVGMAAVLVVLCALIGVIGAPEQLGGRGRRTWGLAGFAAIGALGLAAVLTRAGAVATDAVPTLVGTLVGLWALGRLWRSGDGTSESRRRVLAWAVGLTAGGALVAVVGQLGSGRQQTEAERAALRVPEVADPVTVPAGAQVDAPGVSTYVTPNDDFYRIDTALVPRSLDRATGSSGSTGWCDQEVTIGFDELLAQADGRVVDDADLRVQHRRRRPVGNAVWTGWPIRELLARAEPCRGPTWCCRPAGRLHRRRRRSRRSPTTGSRCSPSG